tara:strand:+ start:1493 stop:1666 length:174 start_codon:yes stop_codon:yes gene_type:complete
MKKFIPYLLFSATTFHAFLGTLPVTAMGCASKTDKVEVVCKEGDSSCQKKVSDSTIN